MGRRVAFLIGNQTFRPDSNLPSLKGPLNDIAALSRVLGNPERGGFDVRQFPDEESSTIKAAIEEELTTAERGDLVLVHYAGHGKLDRVGNLCLATADTRAGTLLSTSIPARHLRDLAANSDCDAVVLFLDCCYSGAAAGDLRGDVESQLRSLQDASGFYILTASSEIQTAGEAEENRNGIVMGRFTAAIVDGIETGNADRDRDGQIFLYDIVRHVKAVVKKQTPQFLAAKASGDPLIAMSPSTAAPLLDPGALADLASDNWRHRLGAVAYLAGIAQGKDGASATAAQDLLLRHRGEERDVEVRRRIEEAVSAFAPTAKAPDNEEQASRVEPSSHRSVPSGERVGLDVVLSAVRASRFNRRYVFAGTAIAVLALVSVAILFVFGGSTRSSPTSASTPPTSAAAPSTPAVPSQGTLVKPSSTPLIKPSSTPLLAPSSTPPNSGKQP